ncbi:MAG: hypothetical protein LBV74_00705 [Tannerella sp.]|jgi:hypothetical protein|nr:hypothetical protein [Tannerella sp.]
MKNDIHITSQMVRIISLLPMLLALYVNNRRKETKHRKEGFQTLRSNLNNISIQAIPMARSRMYEKITPKRDNSEILQSKSLDF